MKINYFFEEVEAFTITEGFESWLSDVEKSENLELLINYIFVTNKKILEVNKQFLKHDYFTDIITFDLSECNKKIKSDIFISVETVQENANDRNLPFEEELTRVMAHGILHLIGFGDKTEVEQNEMTKQEDLALNKIFTVSRETK